jgi:hypothetical protein
MERTRAKCLIDGIVLDDIGLVPCFFFVVGLVLMLIFGGNVREVPSFHVHSKTHNNIIGPV